ncbi:hypothetical protein CWI42_120130 [Ordospora colligata]|uniref:Clathrin/coatomer adaptor adaptin-like N-terminal domain-containing protein n=1 Tax=Ordospora colligata OC4 TaxID=1354746 RepID=A0A0B2UCQ6_9MICR|nr:uncharacterized protein M896_120130 [Ordospora colligata OC4]KHN68796.1 hypothetical protein M896_120130 [Ordospora colligata OC4]TBU13830.1 hypothetical protein CWI40_120130 [Ordospora colligata]TBU14019.1 hypothetical protein CWI41_120130 [Ordospora colligata]TBU17688.1 hypothetical protein CWI42_120130 [Ordospora colligata]
MPIKIEPLLASFISSTRDLSGKNQEDAIIKERRRIACSNESEPHVRYSNILKTIYIQMLAYKINDIDFVKACDSGVQRIKSAGYLGLMAIDGSESIVMAINTIMKDLSSKESRNNALTAICNLNNNNLILDNLMRYVCPNNIQDPFHKKALVAYHKLHPNSKVNIVGKEHSDIYIKAQIVVDKFMRTGNIDATENDILFLISLFTKADDPFLKVKLIEIFGILHSKDHLSMNQAFINSMDAVIIPPKDKIRLQIEIALSIEATILLLKANKCTPKTEAFVFRLIESQNPNSRHFGFQIARVYKIHREIAIDRCIKLGLHNHECLKTLIALIGKSNHKAIYKRKDEIIFHMEKDTVSRKQINSAIAAVFSKIAIHAKDDLLIKIYQEVPEVCLSTPLDKNIPKDCMLKLFNRICITINSRYFPLIYQLLHADIKNENFYNVIFERHLNILAIKRSNPHEIETLGKLLDCMFLYGVPAQNREILISKYKEVQGYHDSIDILNMMLDTIYLLNVKTDDQVVHIFGKYFIYLSLHLHNKKEIAIKHDPDLRIRMISQSIDINKTQEIRSNESIISTYSAENLNTLEIEVFVEEHSHAVHIGLNSILILE